MGDVDRKSASIEIVATATCLLSDAEEPLNVAGLEVSGIVPMSSLLATKAEEG